MIKRVCVSTTNPRILRIVQHSFKDYYDAVDIVGEQIILKDRFEEGFSERANKKLKELKKRNKQDFDFYVTVEIEAHTSHHDAYTRVCIMVKKTNTIISTSFIYRGEGEVLEEIGKKMKKMIKV